jgi:hypothetical protein
LTIAGPNHNLRIIRNKGANPMPPASPTPRANEHAQATIAALSRPGDLRALPIVIAELVVATRLAARFERAGRDPLPDLARRYGNIEAATALDALLRLVTRVWPEPFAVARPCCARLTPDEATLAAMARAARCADRAGFADQLAGFVRADRHEPLYRATLHAVALLPCAG